MSEEKVDYELLNHDLRVAYKVQRDVKYELHRQRELYGVQRHSHGKWLPILTEELGEVAQAMQEGTKAYKDTDADDLYKELIQVAAVAVSWATQIRDNHERQGDSKWQSELESNHP